jgi:FMN phosphatase YigB (HAD superfamily)
VYDGVKHKLNGVKVLAVDLIGTLAERVGMSFPGRASEHLAKNGYDITPARFRSLYRKRYLEYSMGNYVSDREFYKVLAADLSCGAGQPGLEALTDIWLQCSPSFEDAQPFLQQASRTHRLILSSNYVGEWARRLLANNHWEQYFEALVVSSECGFRKPSCNFFHELVKVSGVASPQEILEIGDCLINDVYGATHAGLQAMLVRRNPETGASNYPSGVPCVQSLLEVLLCLTGDQPVGAECRR